MDTKLGQYFKLLVRAEDVHHELPLHQRPEIDDISKGLPQMGPHLLRRKGQGYQFFDMHEFVSGSDDPRFIHPKYSAKRGKLIFIEKEAEVRHHFYMWRDSSKSMDWKSDKAIYTPKEAAEIMIMALSKHLTRHHEKIGMLETGLHTQGGHVAEWLATQWAADETQNEVPQIQRRLVRDSSAFLFSDFLGNPDTLANTLRDLQAQRISGWIVMVEDPQMFNFDFKGHKLFEGPEGETAIDFQKVQSLTLRQQYQAAFAARIALIEKITDDHGFKFILQRTDEPLHRGLLAIYNMAPSKPDSVQKLGLI